MCTDERTWVVIGNVASGQTLQGFGQEQRPKVDVCRVCQRLQAASRNRRGKSVPSHSMFARTLGLDPVILGSDLAPRLRHKKDDSQD